MESPQAPQAQNPQQTAQQQTQSNVQTAIANATLGNTNQVTPYGSLNYTQTGGQDVGGNWVPSYTATQTLSPDQQQIYDSQTGLTKQALGTVAPNILNQIQSSTSQPLNFNNAAPLPGDQTQAKDQAYQALTARSTQDLNTQQQQQATQLANQGIAPGSEAYNNAMLPIERARVDASNQATINSGNVAGQNINQAQQLRQQTIGEDQTLYNQPINTYAALTGASGGMTNPTYAAPSAGQVAPTDVAGIYGNAYNQQMQQYQVNQQANNATMGGLFGLGGSVLGAAGRLAPLAFMPSDARIKENIRRIGTADNGLTIYAYNLRGEQRTQIGVMAQEVEAINPAAVVEFGGVKHVDYARAFDAST